jgi:hypothetical protein
MNTDPKQKPPCDGDTYRIKDKLNALYSTESSELTPDLIRLQSVAVKTSDKE